MPIPSSYKTDLRPSTHIFKKIATMDPQTQFHVLAVDDSIIDRKLIERLLKSSFRVTVVDSVSKALEFLGLLSDENEGMASVHPHEVEVNLIITDYSMPGLTGYDLLRRIKGSSYLKDIPVIIMSSENVPSRINRCLEEGAEEFFLKPVQQSDVNRIKPHLLREEKGLRGVPADPEKHYNQRM